MFKTLIFGVGLCHYSLFLLHFWRDRNLCLMALKIFYDNFDGCTLKLSPWMSFTSQDMKYGINNKLNYGLNASISVHCTFYLLFYFGNILHFSTIFYSKKKKPAWLIVISCILMSKRQRKFCCSHSEANFALTTKVLFNMVSTYRVSH